MEKSAMFMLGVEHSLEKQALDWRKALGLLKKQKPVVKPVKPVTTGIPKSWTANLQKTVDPSVQVQRYQMRSVGGNGLV